MTFHGASHQCSASIVGGCYPGTGGQRARAWTEWSAKLFDPRPSSLEAVSCCLRETERGGGKGGNLVRVLWRNYDQRQGRVL